MKFNLIDERWIPVLRRSGSIERIAPWQIAEAEHSPLRVQSGRPDFDAALLEFLIGLVQTVFSPKDGEDWAGVYEGVRIKPELLQKKMEPVRDAFWLDGDGPRFMQDLTVHQDGPDHKPVASLLMDDGVSGDSSLFAKSGRYEAFCLPDAAAAIMTLQAFAPSGGAGHRTSLRGGGPISVTLQDEDLWRTVWCNILSQKALRSIPGDLSRDKSEDIFPWMAPTRTSEKKGDPGISPEQIHPLQHYWAMPRRYRFHFEDGVGSCDICGEVGVPVVRSFLSRNYGANYKGPYLHPLTPYTDVKPGQPPNPKKGDGAGLSYRDWPLVCLGGEARIPPRVVDVFQTEERWRTAPVRQLFARGYAVDNMKPLRFLEAGLPVLHVEEAFLDQLQDDATKLVRASEEVRRTLNQQVKAAWKKRPKEQPGDVQARVDAAFWDQTTAAFFDSVRETKGALEKEDAEERIAAKKRYLQAIHQAALEVFDELCPLEVELGPDNLARTARARRALLVFTRPDTPKLLTAVGLAVEERRAKRRAGTGRKGNPKEV